MLRKGQKLHFLLTQLETIKSNNMSQTDAHEPNYTSWYNPQKSCFYYQLSAFDTIVLFATRIDNSLSEVEKSSRIQAALQSFHKGYSLCKAFHYKLSAFESCSELSRIHNGSPAAVEISSETYQILEAGLYYSALSGGNFDISIGGLSKLWHWKEGAVPLSEQIAEALQHVNYRALKLFHTRAHYYAQLQNSKARLDLGGIAKGYIADALHDLFVAEGVDEFLINLGGTLRTHVSNSEPWVCGIAHPQADKEPLALIELANAALVSSGIYERGFWHNEHWYHHIISPQTGYPASVNHAGVSILAQSALVAEGLSTSFLMLDTQEVYTLALSIPEIHQVFFTTNEGELISLL